MMTILLPSKALIKKNSLIDYSTMYTTFGSILVVSHEVITFDFSNFSERSRVIAGFTPWLHLRSIPQKNRHTPNIVSNACFEVALGQPKQMIALIGFGFWF